LCPDFVILIALSGRQGLLENSRRILPEFLTSEFLLCIFKARYECGSFDFDGSSLKISVHSH
jgi:hypothetical protein